MYIITIVCNLETPLPDTSNGNSHYGMLSLYV